MSRSFNILKILYPRKTRLDMNSSQISNLQCCNLVSDLSRSSTSDGLSHMCSASISLWFPFFRPPQILHRSKESLTLVLLELFSTGCLIGFTQVFRRRILNILWKRSCEKWNLICAQWALYAPISSLVDFRSLNFVQRFKSGSSQSSWHCLQKSFQSKFWIL